MSYLVQMAGLTVHNFVSAATGIALAIALVRGFARRSAPRHRQLLGRSGPLHALRPAADLRSSSRLFFVWQGVPQNFGAYTEATTLEGAKQMIAQGPVASQEVIKMLGTNGGGFFNANSAHPFENPNAAHQLRPDAADLRASRRGAHLHVRPHGRRHSARAGRSSPRWPSCSWPACSSPTAPRRPAIRDRRSWASTPTPRRCSRAATWRARRSASASPTPRCSPSITTAASCGAVNAHARQLHAARRPGPAVQHPARRGHLRRRRRRPLRHADLRHPRGLHRRPDGRPHARVPRQEDRGQGGEDGDARHPRPAVSHPRLHRARRGAPTAGLAGRRPTRARTASARSSTPTRRRTGNNGSAFAGLTANTPFYNTTLGLAMLIGRFLMIVPILALAGSLAAKKIVPAIGRHLPDHRPALRRPARRRDPDRRRADLLPGARARPDRRALRDAGGHPLLESRTVMVDMALSRLAGRRLRTLSDPTILGPALVDAFRKLDPRLDGQEPGDVRGRGRRDADHGPVHPRPGRPAAAALGFSVQIALALVHRAVRQLRRGHGRRPRQGAGGDACARPRPRPWPSA